MCNTTSHYYYVQYTIYNLVHYWVLAFDHKTLFFFYVLILYCLFSQKYWPVCDLDPGNPLVVTLAQDFPSGWIKFCFIFSYQHDTVIVCIWPVATIYFNFWPSRGAKFVMNMKVPLWQRTCRKTSQQLLDFIFLLKKKKRSPASSQSFPASYTMRPTSVCKKNQHCT